MEILEIIGSWRKLVMLLFVLPLASCGQKKETQDVSGVFKKEKEHTENSSGIKQDTATFAAGCFWCVEEQFKQLSGVLSVTSGYTGGTTVNPTYEEVSNGVTGHAEACNIVYDPSVISYPELLEAFFTAHDPTQLNRQGNDIGTQYRSAVFYHNAEQQNQTLYYIKRLNEEKAYADKVVTEVVPYKVFYKAEDYHQNYYENNKEQPYCRYVISPKIDKFRKVFKEKIR